MKYMIVTRGNQFDQNRCLEIENYCFEKIKSFMCPKFDTSSQNNYDDKNKTEDKSRKQVLFCAVKIFRSNES